MIKTFQIDFVRAVLEWQLARNHNESSEFFSNNDIKLASFYEHLNSNEEVDRFVEIYQQLARQQNKENTIGVGVVATTDTPTITNMWSSFVSPFEWSVNIRTTLGNRDKMLGTCYKLIEELKGRKIDIASLHEIDENGNYLGEKLFPVKNIETEIESGDFIGQLSVNTSVGVANRINELLNILGISQVFSFGFVVYAENTNHLLTKWQLLDNVWTDVTDEMPLHSGFDKMKIDMSFDNIVCDEPRVLNANEYCEITFGGSSTLCNHTVRLGNDLVRVFIGKDKIVTSNDGSSDIDLKVNGLIRYHELEPMEMPNSLSANTEQNMLRSNFFLSNSNTDSVSATLQYTFLCDMSVELIKQWFDYARYYKTNTPLGEISVDSITPNIIYSIKEYWSNWGEVEVVTISGKIFGDIEIENTESDILTLGVSFQLQGDNN